MFVYIPELSCVGKKEPCEEHEMFLALFQDILLETSFILFYQKRRKEKVNCAQE